MTEIYKPEGYFLNTPENKELTHSLCGLENAINTNKTLEAKVIRCDSEHNLIVDLGRYTGIIPKDEAVMSFDGECVRDIAVITRVGKSVCFKVCEKIKEENGETQFLLSRRKAQEECYENYISHLKSGDIVDARITHIEPFGVFCDIGCGFVSLLTIDSISVSRINHPRERFHTSQYIKAIVRAPADDCCRITLTHKELLGTWEENAESFSPGETVSGIIRSIEPYGIFVELAPNLAGLAEWRDDVHVGESAAVYIKSIIPEKMKIKLVIVDSYNSDAEITPLKYYVNDNHIDYWQYSPVDSEKVVVTDFTADTDNKDNIE